MRFIRFAVAVSAGLGLALSALGQEKKMEKKGEAKAPAKMEMPKPGPEVQKLSYFVGNWTGQGEMKENPYGMPAGKFTSSDKCEWFPGGYQVVCHGTGKGPMGTMHGLGIISYNSEEKTYTYYGVDNMGMASLSKGKVDGNTWVFTAEEKMGGKTFHGRYTMDTSPDSYTYKYETSPDGQTWSTMMDGKANKGGGAAKKAPAAEKKS
jgi:hypothetical protein